MALKYQVDKLEDVEEAHRALYIPSNGKFVLAVEGAVGKDKLDEFRDNNVKLQQQIDKFKNIDPAKHQELLELQRKLQEQELIEKGEVDKLVNLRVTTMKETLQTQIDQLTNQLTGANSQLGVLLIDNVVKDAAIKAGVAPTAVDDVLLRARGVYSVVEGKPVPKNAEGKVIYGTDGATPMPVNDWVTGLKKTAPHLFQGFKGGGAGGGDGNPPPGDWKDMTPAQKIALGLKNGVTGLNGAPS
jgi:SpoVK/Ycf46/Vps4 family AAA+-type ATPase